MTTDVAPDPYRVRVNLPRAVACLPGMVNPVKNHEQFLELIFALAGPGFQRAYERFLADPEGRRLLDERPDVVATLTDLDRLRRCPPGSLGHAYLDFMSQNRLDAGLYGDAHHDLPAIAERLGWDDDFLYVVHRGIALHDVFHVLGAYGPDIGGEVGVIGFSHGQVNGWITGATLGMVLALPMGSPRKRRLQWWNESVRRGRDAAMLFAAPYEEWLDDPIDDVRTRLGIAATGEAHPGGYLYSRFQFGMPGKRMMDDAYDRYEYDPRRDLSGAEFVGV